jgi:hypothetical protein
MIENIAIARMNNVAQIKFVLFVFIVFWDLLIFGVEVEMFLHVQESRRANV